MTRWRASARSSAWNIYRIQAPQAPAGQTDVLTVSLTAMPVNGIVPIVSVYDANANPVTTQILLNGNGTYIVQATGLSPGATYYLRVSAAPASGPAAGNYSLVADFNGVPAQVQTFVGGTLSQSEPQDDVYLVCRPDPTVPVRPVHRRTPGLPTDAQVRMEIYDSTGQLVFSLLGGVGQTVSGASVLLTPGQYQVLLLGRERRRGGVAHDPLSTCAGPISRTPSARPRRTRRMSRCIPARTTPRSIATATRTGSITPPMNSRARSDRRLRSDVFLIEESSLDTAPERHDICPNPPAGVGTARGGRLLVRLTRMPPAAAAPLPGQDVLAGARFSPKPPTGFERDPRGLGPTPPHVPPPSVSRSRILGPPARRDRNLAWTHREHLDRIPPRWGSWYACVQVTFPREIP